MQITTFNPMILSRDADEIIKLFEALGFERCHTVDNIDGKDISSVRMTDANGFHVDVARVESMDRDMTTMRMNVRDFDEAYQMLEEKGFQNAQGGRITDTGTSRSTMMVSPSGFSISIAEHIKNHD